MSAVADRKRDIMSGFFDDIGTDLDDKKATDEEAFDAPKFDPNKGDELHGVFLKAEAFTNDSMGYAPTVLITFRNVGEKEIGGVEAGASGVLFCPTVLRRKLFESTPAMNTPFALRFEGSVTPEKGGRTYKDWTLYTAYMKEATPDALDIPLWRDIQSQVDVGDRRTSAPQGADGEWKF